MSFRDEAAALTQHGHANVHWEALVNRILDAYEPGKIPDAPPSPYSTDPFVAPPEDVLTPPEEVV
jgi:hypothetical protein